MPAVRGAGLLTQVNLLIAKSDAGLPLYLSLATAELSLEGQFERLTSTVTNLHATVDQIVNSAIIPRLEETFNKHLVRTVLEYLSCVEYGLSTQVGAEGAPWYTGAPRVPRVLEYWSTSST